MFTAVVFGLALLGEKPLVLWDGLESTPGVGWVGGQCKTATIKRAENAYRFHTSDPKTFAEWGWQWASWKPEFTGTDIRPYKTLTVELRVFGDKLPTDLLLSLRSPGDHHLTKNDSLKKREPSLLDGKWKKITVPLAEIPGRDEKFDPAHTVQIIFGVWVEQGDFTVDVRRVELSKQWGLLLWLGSRSKLIPQNLRLFAGELGKRRDRVLRVSEFEIEGRDEAGVVLFRSPRKPGRGGSVGVVIGGFREVDSSSRRLRLVSPPADVVGDAFYQPAGVDLI